MNVASSSLFSIMWLTLRQQIHSKSLFWLMGCVLCVSGVFPLLLGMYGAPHPIADAALTYTQPLTFLLLLAATIWMTASATAHAIENRDFQTFRVTPVSSITILFGKWLGIVVINALLLALSGATTSLVVPALMHRDQDMSLYFMNAHAALRVDEEDLKQTAAEATYTLTREPVTPHNATFLHILNSMKMENYRIPPGESHTWRLRTHDFRPVSQQNGGYLVFSFHCNPFERQPVSGTWRIHQPGREDSIIAVSRLLDGEHRLALPSDFSWHDTTEKVTLTFENDDDSVTVYFNLQSPAKLLLPQHSFTANIVRSHFLFFCFLTAAAALTFIPGVIFSFPVAVFTMLSFVLALLIPAVFVSIPMAEHTHGPGVFGGPVSNMGEILLQAIHRYTASTLTLLPLQALARAIAIPNQAVQQAILRLHFLTPCVAFVIACVLVKRKEFP